MMIRTLCLFTCILTFACFNIAVAQNSKYQFGVEGGPGLCFALNGSFKTIGSPTIGGSAGFSFQYQFSRFLALKSNLFFERKGYEESVTSPASQGTAYCHFDYLVLPVLFRVYFDQGNHFFFNTGPYFGCLLSQTYTFETFKTHSFEKSFKRFDLGIALGFGGSFRLYRNFSMSVELRELFGLFNINKNSDSGNSDNLSYKTFNNSLTCLIGFHYLLN